ncbi:MAG: AAC(3) family N-acetyltransferase [Planctomycetota bacterium]|jgi:aminoglycoside 3-N-acetyltransferase
MEKKNIIPRILNGLETIGVRKNDCLLVQSSFKSLGLKDRSPADVIETFLEYLGSKGTLVMPTFSYCYSDIWGMKPYNPKTSPGINNGILTETLRKHPKSLRSSHPTYSVAAIGKYAKQIIENKENTSPLGKGSSYQEILTLGGKTLLLGVGNNRNSMIHHAEAVSNLPYNDIPFREFWGRTALIEKDGKSVEVPLPNEFPACSENFSVADSYLEQKGILKKEKICHADSMLIDANKMVNAIVEKLVDEPAWLLCDNIVCEPCTLRKRRLKQKGLI